MMGQGEEASPKVMDEQKEGRKEADPEELGKGYSSLRPCAGFCLVAELSDPSGPYGLWLARLLCPWGSPGKNTGVVSHFLLQGIFPTQGSKPHLPHWQVEAIAHPSPLGEGELRCLRTQESEAAIVTVVDWGRQELILGDKVRVQRALGSMGQAWL